MQRLESLNRARNLAIAESKYDQAIKILNTLLVSDELDIDALRLMGNILDLKAASYFREKARSPAAQRLHEKARKCYETILRLDPDNTVALIDMGDYWERTGQPEKALSCYERAIENLKRGRYYLSYDDECESAFWKKARVLQEMGFAAEYRRCLDTGREMCPRSELLRE